MKITASNGRDYDLENLTPSDTIELIRLKHLSNPVEDLAIDSTPSVSVISIDEIADELQEDVEGVDALKKPKKK